MSIGYFTRSILFLALLSASPALAGGPQLLFLAVGNRITTQSYSSPGNYSFTVPAGASDVVLTVAGGGGGGGTNSPNPTKGDLVVSSPLSTLAGETLDIVVGAGGEDSNGSTFASGGAGYPAGGNAEDVYSGGGGGGSAVALHTGSVLIQSKGGDGGNALSGDGGGTNSGGTVTIGGGGAGGLSNSLGGFPGWVIIQYYQ